MNGKYALIILLIFRAILRYFYQIILGFRRRMQKFANLEAMAIMAIMAHLQSSIRSIIYQLRWCFFTVFFPLFCDKLPAVFHFLVTSSLASLANVCKPWLRLETTQISASLLPRINRGFGSGAWSLDNSIINWYGFVCLIEYPQILWIIIIWPIESYGNNWNKCHLEVYQNWLVVWNMNLIFPSGWEFHDPNWLSYFSEELKPPRKFWHI